MVPLVQPGIKEILVLKVEGVLKDLRVLWVTGPQGGVGATGPVGYEGPNGETGQIGHSGPQGPNGATGATGIQGQSTIGNTGAPGAPGSVGLPGPTGPHAIGATGPAGAKGRTGPTGTAYPGQLPKGATGAPGLGQNGPTGPTGAGGQPTSCYEVYSDSVTNFDYLVQNPPSSLSSAQSTDQQGLCPSGTTAASGARQCLTGGWKGSYAYPQVGPNGVSVGWNGNCGAGPVRIFVLCCPMGSTPAQPSYSY